MFKSLVFTIFWTGTFAYTTYYASDICGQEIQLTKPAILRASKDGNLPSNFKCAVTFKGQLNIIGGQPLVMARVLKMNFPPGNGVNCTDGMIELIDGVLTPRVITDKGGLCGRLPPKKYDFVTANSSFMAISITTSDAPQKADFQFLMQSFQSITEGGECFPGEFECKNDRCISNSVKCDGYDNCGDLSDEAYDKCFPTVYLDEICGMTLDVFDMVKLKASRSTDLIPSLSCSVDIASHIDGGLGGRPRILAHVKQIDLQPQTQGSCSRVRIDLYDGIRSPFRITGPGGICGHSQFLGQNFATYNDSFMVLDYKADPNAQVGSFEFTLTAFHPSSQGCYSGEWECQNGRCIDKYLQCNGRNNCGDNSDENNDLCDVLKGLAGGAIAAIVLATLLFVIGFPLLLFYVLCRKKRKPYSSI